jgi:hypothetical protein
VDGRRKRALEGYARSVDASKMLHQGQVGRRPRARRNFPFSIRHSTAHDRASEPDVLYPVANRARSATPGESFKSDGTHSKTSGLKVASRAARKETRTTRPGSPEAAHRYATARGPIDEQR